MRRGSKTHMLYIIAIIIAFLPTAFADMLSTPADWSFLFTFGVVTVVLLLYIGLVGVNTILELPIVWALNRNILRERSAIAITFLANAASGIIPATLSLFLPLLLVPPLKPISLAIVAIAEVLVILIEAEVYRRLSMKKRAAYTTSILSNAFTATVGIAIISGSLPIAMDPAFLALGILGFFAGIVMASKDRSTASLFSRFAKNSAKTAAAVLVIAAVCGYIFGTYVTQGNYHTVRKIDPKDAVRALIQSYVDVGGGGAQKVEFQEGETVDVADIGMLLGLSIKDICVNPATPKFQQSIKDLGKNLCDQNTPFYCEDKGKSKIIAYRGSNSIYRAKIFVYCGQNICPGAKGISCGVTVLSDQKEA